MSFQYQLIDLKNDLGILAISGNCNSSEKFIYQCNQAIRQLLKRGGWYGTEVLIKLCVDSCLITLPRYVGTLLGAEIGGVGFATIHNNWYSIVGPQCCFGNYNFEGGVSLRDDGTAATYRDIRGTTGKQIAYHVTKQADIGKTITIYGFKYGGQPLQTKNSDGTWSDGVTITATAAGGVVLPAMTTDMVTKITSVVREATAGMAYLYTYGADSTGANVLTDIAAYEPNETNPRYRRMRILQNCSVPRHEDDYGRNIATVNAMVKLEWIPLVNDSDFLIVDDFDAIRYAIQAIRQDESGDAAAAEAFWTKAIRELNMLDRQKTPFRQTSVRVRTGAGMISNPI